MSNFPLFDVGFYFSEKYTYYFANSFTKARCSKFSIESEFTMPTKEIPRLYRIHIGGISPDLAKSISDLETRITKFGHVVKPLELHQKSTLNYHFAYISMHLKRSEFLQLKMMFDGTRFKGSKLSLQLANDDFQTRWKKDFKRQDTNIAARKLRELTALKRSERINNKDVNPFELSRVCRGRMRKTPRKEDLKNLTIRIKVGGRLKIIKCLKSKLWGYDKNRKIRDLTYRFVGGEWRDGNDHVVDRISGKTIVFDDSGISVRDNTSNKMKDEIDMELKEEQTKTNLLLARILNQYNFDQPVEIDEFSPDHKNSDSENDTDYETSHKISSIEPEVMTVDYDKTSAVSFDEPSLQASKFFSLSNESEPNTEKQDEKKVETSYNENIDSDDEMFYRSLRPQPVVDEKGYKHISHSDNNYENLDPVPSIDETNDQNSNRDGVDDKEQLEDITEDEFIPSFGKSITRTADESDNTTEKLRSLLSISSTSQQISLLDTPTEDVQIATPGLKAFKNVGLYFSHFDSPFLVAQTQISKLKEVKFNEELKYDEWFWENRGDLNREFRKLRRDALRRNKKKQRSQYLI